MDVTFALTVLCIVVNGLGSDMKCQARKHGTLGEDIMESLQKGFNIGFKLKHLPYHSDVRKGRLTASTYLQDLYNSIQNSELGQKQITATLVNTKKSLKHARCFRIHLDIVRNRARDFSAAELCLPLESATTPVPELVTLNSKRVSWSRFKDSANKHYAIYNVTDLVRPYMYTTATRDPHLILVYNRFTNSISRWFKSDLTRGSLFIVYYGIPVLQDILKYPTQITNNRFKREESERTSSSAQTSGTCQLHRWYLKFSEVKWDRIIFYPKGFYMNYCKGSCPAPLNPATGKVNSTNHSFVKVTYHTATNNAHIATIPRATCVPMHYSRLTVIYLHKDGQVRLHTIKDVIADSCGCL